MYKPLTDGEFSDAEERVRLGDPTVIVYLPRLLSELSESRRRLRFYESQSPRNFSTLTSVRPHIAVDPPDSLGSE